MAKIIVSFEDLSYQYPKSGDFALVDINLEIKRGEFFGLIGPTGAGKSTLCKALNGIVPQYYGGRFFGRLVVAGMDTLDHPISELARHVGQVFEDPETQLITTSVENEIAFMLENLKVPRAEILQKIPQVLAMVRLQGMEKKHPGELSGGQKQRLAIATALAAQPDLLVLDEPTSQLDPVGAEEVFSTVHRLNKEKGMTILMASQSAEELAQYADRIGLILQGKLIKVGMPGDIYAQVDLLQKQGLRPPQVAETFYSLRSKGLPIKRIPVRLDEGMDALTKLVTQTGVVISPPDQFSQPTRPAGVPLIRIRDLVYRYPEGTEALKGVSLDIHPGEYVLIAGQNGAGKTTLVKHFLNLLQSTSGKVQIAGVEISQLSISDLAVKIGYVAQNPDAQIFNQTVWEEVAFALKHLNYPEGEITRLAATQIAAMGLAEMHDMHPLALPKGDRARIVMAAILAMEPEMVIFDEPTTGQDYRGAKAILDISKNLHQQGKTVVVITHHLYLMPGYAERVIVMGKGTILLDASIRQAFHANETLAQTYLTPPQAVLLAQHLGRLQGEDYPLLTPAKLADCFHSESRGDVV